MSNTQQDHLDKLQKYFIEHNSEGPARFGRNGLMSAVKLVSVKKVQITEGNLVTLQGYWEATITVLKENSNMLGSLHGGAIATLADELSSYAIMSLDKSIRGSVSVNLSVNYLSAAMEGSVVTYILNFDSTIWVFVCGSRLEGPGVLLQDFSNFTGPFRLFTSTYFRKLHSIRSDFLQLCFVCQSYWKTSTNRIRVSL